MDQAAARDRPNAGHLGALLADVVPVGIVQVDAAGRCVYVNERWCQLSGVSRQAAHGVRWTEVIHPVDRARVFAEWREAVRQRSQFTVEFRYQTGDGDVRTVSARMLPLFADDAELSGHVGAVADISDRMRTEATLRELAYELGERVKELDCLFGISHIVEQSDGSLDYIFQETANLLPSSWEYPDITCARVSLDGTDFCTANFSDSPWKQQADIVVNGERRGSVEVLYLAERAIRDEGPFRDEERRLLNAIAERLGRVVERITARGLMQQQEHELRARLTHLTRVSTVGEMASSIAHEVSQPLTAIATYTQACRRLIDSGAAGLTEVRDVLGRITEEALRAGGIIHRLKDLVRRRRSGQVECDVNDLIRDVVHLASVDARLHDVTLRLALAPALPHVLADGVQIQQVVLNLVRNGIDATQGTDMVDGEVGVRTDTTPDGEVLVSVDDNGCGLPADVGDDLFQPFFTTKESGMGLGLSISRSIVLSHGGRMWYTAHPDRGTTFQFTLPVMTEEG